MATPAERDLLASEILTSVAQSAERLPPACVSGFLCMRGNAYAGGLMVVGRATNGWETGLWKDGIRPADLASQAEPYAQSVFERSAPADRCPMQWVADGWRARDRAYNTKRSQFWSVIHRAVDRLGLAVQSAENWPSTLVWSNLYKVAPTQSGNPGAALCRAQLRGCIALHQLELVTYRPAHVLYLTGLNWAAPFLPAARDGHSRRSHGAYVDDHGAVAVGDGTPAAYVVAKHPQGKRLGQWVDEVLTSFDDLAKSTRDIR